MIRFACPSCEGVFSATDDKAGKTGTCPKCKAQFIIPTPEPVAVAPPPPPPPPPAPKPKPAPIPQAPVEIAIKPCPGCQGQLTVSTEYLGQSVSCPYCQTVFTAEAPTTAPKVAKVAAVIPAPVPTPAAPPKVESKSKATVLLDDDEDEVPRKKRKRLEDDEDEDEMPRKKKKRYEDDEDDEDEKPRKRRRLDDDDDDDEDDDRPRKGKGKARKRAVGARKKSGSGAGSPILIIAGIMGILFGGAICFFAYEDSSIFNVSTKTGDTTGMPSEVKSMVNKMLMVIWCIRFYDLASFIAGPSLVIGGIGLLMKQMFGKFAGLVGSGGSAIAIIFGLIVFLILLTIDSKAAKNIDEIDAKFYIRMGVLLIITAFNFIVLLNKRHTDELE